MISSAIVNAPPPEMMGDILNKRNKLHHLDHEVSEQYYSRYKVIISGRLMRV